MRKTIWTLNINEKEPDKGYCPEVTELTYPLIAYWADKIGARFRIIKTRKFPDWPVVYEKLQIHELGRDSDWNIYIDSDALVNPDMFDITAHLPPYTVAHHGLDLAGNRFRYDEFFLRDRRFIGSCNWMTVAPRECLDLWHPLDDLTLDQAVGNILPTLDERIQGVVTRDHLIDDYTLSRNIARYGLKCTSAIEIFKHVGNPNVQYFWHDYRHTAEQKLMEMKKVLAAWKLICGKCMERECRCRKGGPVAGEPIPAGAAVAEKDGKLVVVS